jgi:hypothetical protein
MEHLAEVYTIVGRVSKGEQGLKHADFPRIRLGVCPGNHSLRGQGDTGRCKARGSKPSRGVFAGIVEDVFGPRTRQMPADRLPQQNGIPRIEA